jgi:hypothetical protein
MGLMKWINRLLDWYEGPVLPCHCGTIPHDGICDHCSHGVKRCSRCEV